MNERNLGKLETKLQDFITEISKLREEEMKEGKTVHLVDVNPEELVLEDAECWVKIKDGSLTKEALKHYSGTLFDENGAIKKEIPESRFQFFAFINNKANVVFLKRDFGKKVK